MKKLLVILTIAAMALAMVACGSTASSLVPSEVASESVTSEPATSSTEEVDSEIMVGEVLYLTGTVNSITDTAFNITLADGISDGVNIVVYISDETVFSFDEPLEDGMFVNVGCVRIDDENVDGVTVDLADSVA